MYTLFDFLSGESRLVEKDRHAVDKLDVFDECIKNPTYNMISVCNKNNNKLRKNVIKLK